MKFGRQVAWWWRSYLGGACIKGVAGNLSQFQNPFGLKTGRNDPVRGPYVLGSFPRVLELKMSVLGLRFYLARKTRLYRAQDLFQVKTPY